MSEPIRTWTVERPSALSPDIVATITGSTREEVLAASIRWRNEHWGYCPTIDEPVLVGDVWIATGRRWRSS